MNFDNLIITVVSEQTVPNVQFLKWYTSENLGKTDFLFLTTKKMEEINKTTYIATAVPAKKEYIGNIYKEIIDENSSENDYENILSVLDKFFIDKDYKKEVLNITGGTKLMALALYEYFTKKDNVEIYYKTFNQNLLKIYPDKNSYNINGLITLQESLNTCGIEITQSEHTTMFSFDKYVDFNKKYDTKTRNALSKGLSLLRDCKNSDETFNLRKNPSCGSYLPKLENVCDFWGFNIDKVTASQVSFLKGGWFEDFTYLLIKESKNIPEDNIIKNVKVEQGNVSNEFDVIYLDSQDSLNIVECKSSLQKDEIENSINKLQALTTKFNKSLTAHFYTAFTYSGKIKDRAKQYGIEIVELGGKK